jgi:PPOX class probable F420-dependent enzyme
MELPADVARQRFRASRRVLMATVRPDGTPHLVPIVFALSGDVVYTAVDAKPKRTPRLQRLLNLEHQPRCSLLADHYDDDWSRLWWVRADGEAAVIDASDPASAEARAALAERYEDYRRRDPIGPYVRVQVTRWSGWDASDD